MGEQESVDVQAGPVHVRAAGFYTTIILCTAGIIGAQFGFFLMHQKNMENRKSEMVEAINHNRDLLMSGQKEMIQLENDIYFAVVMTHSKLAPLPFLKERNGKALEEKIKQRLELQEKADR